MKKHLPAVVLAVALLLLWQIIAMLLNAAYILPSPAQIAAKLWEAFSSWIENGHNDFDDENTIILRVKVTDRVLYFQGRRFEQ